MDDLPVTSHGKIDKFQLKGIACSKQDDLSLDDKKKHLHQGELTMGLCLLTPTLGHDLVFVNSPRR